MATDDTTPTPAEQHTQLLVSAMSKIAQVRTAADVPQWALTLCDAVDMVAAYTIERDRVSLST